MFRIGIEGRAEVALRVGGQLRERRQKMTELVESRGAIDRSDTDGGVARRDAEGDGPGCPLRRRIAGKRPVDVPRRAVVARLQRRFDGRAVRDVVNEGVEVGAVVGRGAHQPVDDGPALGVEGGLGAGAVVDVGFAHRGEELGQRNARALPEDGDVVRYRFAGGDRS